MCIFASLGCAINYYTNITSWVSFVSMGLLALFLIVIFVVPYFELMFAHIYDSLKKENDKDTKTSEQKRKYTKKSDKQELITE